MKNARKAILVAVGLSFGVAAICFRRATTLMSQEMILNSSRQLYNSPLIVPTVERFNSHNLTKFAIQSNGLTFDIVSIGSKTRSDYHKAQQRTFGLHHSIRHFFPITEDDDDNDSGVTGQHCHERLTNNDTYEISQRCRSRRPESHQFVMKYLRSNFATVDWLRKKSNPAGWMCAQRRPLHGFAKAINYYRHHNETLPDFMIIMDDDTYYDMEKVSGFLKDQSGASLSIAGCLIRSPVHLINFTIPFGGWGIIYSKATLENFMRPIRCYQVNVSNDEFLQSACQALRDNQMGERYVFKKGMSLTDLMQAFVSWQPYTEFRNWNYGFCLHSDWIWGYFSNFYHVSMHDPNPFYRNVPYSRLIGYNGSVLYGSIQNPKHFAKRKQCNHDSKGCNRKAHICHYQSPKRMMIWHAKARQLYPHHFRQQ